MFQKSSLWDSLSIPTRLTLVRLFIAPIALPSCFVVLLPFNNFMLNIAVLLLFIVMSLTDFFDGFLARRFDQETELGKALDPIADKFLFYSCFIGLLASGKIFFLWPILFIGRDFFMMGLRQIALLNNANIPVSHWGKIRSVWLMIYIGFLIANPYQATVYADAPWWHIGEKLLLLGSLFFTFSSAYTYYLFFLTHCMKHQASPSHKS